jgi:hypothetical protein
MRALQFITDHVIFKLHCNQISQMKTTNLVQTQIYENNPTPLCRWPQGGTKESKSTQMHMHHLLLHILGP